MFCFCFIRFIPGREIRCAVLETGTDEDGKPILEALPPQEYLVRKNGIRTCDDKLQVDEDGLPSGTVGIILIGS